MKIAVAGCSGRMGLTLLECIAKTASLELTAGSIKPEDDNDTTRALLAKHGFADLSLVTSAQTLVGNAQCIIDFTSPDSSAALAQAAADSGCKLVIGTTGFNDAQWAAIETAAKKTAIIHAGNFSLGVNLLQQLAEKAASILDDSYDAEIYEMHHKHKKDAPSGTALMLGESVAQGRNVSLADKQAVDRNGERKQGDIGFAVQRGGDVIGVHRVSFAGNNELIELSHESFDRSIYANGALHAAKWLSDKSAGLYSMKDVLA